MNAGIPKIIVLGSINMDLVIRTPKLPIPGETLLAKSSHEICGGKGANQAVAAARAGGFVAMIGRVGEDAFAARLVTNLKSELVECQAIQSVPGCASGLAVVAVDDEGENSIMVVPGANGRLSVDELALHHELFQDADILMMQLEVPCETVLAAIDLAKKSNVRVILDPAPVASTWTDRLLEVDLVCPNQAEAEQITGTAIESLLDAEQAAHVLVARGAKHAIITMGSKGAIHFDGHAVSHFQPFEVTAVDTTAAGDAFAGALAVKWGETDDLNEAIQFACAAGAIAASREGAQPSLPMRSEIEQFLLKANRS